MQTCRESPVQVASNYQMAAVSHLTRMLAAQLALSPRNPVLSGLMPIISDRNGGCREENETHEVYLERRKLMNKSDLTFGHGSRSCVGKNIAELELYKAVATLIAQFTVSALQHWAHQGMLTFSK